MKINWKSPIILKVIALLMLLSVASIFYVHAQRDDLNTLILEVQKGNAAALPDLKRMAEQGDTKAQLIVGEFEAFGFTCLGDVCGENKNFSESIRWLRKLAAENNPAAIRAIGRLYEKGKGVKQDYAEALSYYRKSAEQGFAPAQYSIGEMYRDGKGVKQDLDEAKKWFLMSMEQGNGWAMDAMTELYGQTRWPTHLNYPEAYFWLSVNPIVDQYPKSWMAARRDEVVKRLTPEERAAADRRVDEWKKSHTQPLLREWMP